MPRWSKRYAGLHACPCPICVLALTASAMVEHAIIPRFLYVLGSCAYACWPQVTPAAVADAPAGVSCFNVALSSAINAGDVRSLTASAVLATAQTAHPAEISQLENQLMIYTDNLYVVSPYQVSAQTTEVRASICIRGRPAFMPQPSRAALSQPAHVALRGHMQRAFTLMRAMTHACFLCTCALNGASIFLQQHHSTCCQLHGMCPLLTAAAAAL